MALMSNINGREEEIDLYFINDHIFPIKQELDEFIDYLEPAKLKNLGNYDSSNISQILKIVIDSINNNNQPAIIFSDFIFSLERAKKGEILNQLASQKHSLAVLIQNSDLKNKGYGFLILKFNSHFNGRYYDVENSSIRYKGNRPFFVWVIGKNDDLKRFTEKYDVEKYKGFGKKEQALIYEAAASTSEVYYSVLTDYKKEGIFRKVRNLSKDQGVKAIEKIKYDTRHGEKRFSFAIAFDARDLGMSENYIENPDNYDIISDADDEFTVMGIEKLKKGSLKNTERKIAANATHVITVSSNNISPGKQQLSIQLLRKLPTWVNQSSTNDDRNIEKGKTYEKTFGLAYLIEGIAEAYKSLNETNEIYTQFAIELNR